MPSMTIEQIDKVDQFVKDNIHCVCEGKEVIGRRKIRGFILGSRYTVGAYTQAYVSVYDPVEAEAIDIKMEDVCKIGKKIDFAAIMKMK